MSLRPMLRYYGSKAQAAWRYPAPRHDTIIEPFAGAAGYSLRYPNRRVILVERYPVLVGIWRYLIATPAAEILRIPTVDAVAVLPAWVPQEARWLVGFHLSSAVVEPKRTLSSGCRKLREAGHSFYGWSEGARARVAAQVDSIRHWQIIEGDYTAAPQVEAAWFIDPPYIGRPGSHYVHGSSAIDYAALASWCRSRDGQTIVCEADGATWLPFRAFGETTGVGGKRSREAIWLSDEAQQSLPLEVAHG